MLLSFLAGTGLCPAQDAHNPAQDPAAPNQSTEPNSAQPPLFTFKATTRMVIVDVIARDSEDNPVLDLTANDLRVSEKIGDSATAETIASFRPVQEVGTEKAIATSGIVLGWLHKSFCPLKGAYELSYYLSEETRKDGLHRILLNSSRPGLRFFFRPGYRVEADKSAELAAVQPESKQTDSQQQKQQFVETERKAHPELELALVGCYDTLNLTSFHLDVHPVKLPDDNPSSKDKRKQGSGPPTDSYELIVPASFFASLPPSERNHPRHLDFSFCRFESSGRPIREFEGTMTVGTSPEDYSMLSERGFVNTITVERQRCTQEGITLKCDPSLTEAEMQQGVTIRIALSARLAVRDRESGAVGTAELLLLPLPQDPIRVTIPEGQVTDSFGSLSPKTPLDMCGDVYQLAPWTTNLPHFSELDAIAPLYATSYGVYSRFFTAGIPGVTSRTEWFGINYQGTFGVDRPGKYEFDLISDDGAKVYVDNKLVASADAIHPVQRLRGKIQLDSGVHDMRVSYFQGPRTEVALVLLVKPPGSSWRLFDTKDFPSPDQSSYQRQKLSLPKD